MYDHTSTLGHHIEIQGNDSFKLLKLNDIIQWTTLDQHRYAEALGVLPYLFTRNARRILIIGGGDGVIASTLLHYFSNTIEHITILDIDPEIVEVSRTFLDFPNDPKVRVISSDAITAIEGNRTDHYFDLIIGDIDNPSFAPAAPYYTVEFMRHINRTLKADGIFVTTCEAPVANPYAVACLSSTIREAFGRSNTASYHVSMPYCPPPAARGFIITTDYPMQLPIPPSCRYLNPASLSALFAFGNDEICLDAQASTKDNRLYSRLFVTPYSHTLDDVEVDLED
jgi:spermidine synthase